MKEAVAGFREVSTSKEFKERERLWVKTRLDEATALYFAEQAGRDKERAKLEKEKIELEKIILAQQAEIARLSKKNSDWLTQLKKSLHPNDTTDVNLKSMGFPHP